MAKRGIAFKYHSQRYAVGPEVRTLRKILLPDTCVYLEVIPSSLDSIQWLFEDQLREVRYNFNERLEPEEIAKKLNAVLAVEVEVH